MSIFNSNDYNRGHRDGTKDAMNNKDKNYVRSGMSMKFAIHGKKALETYCSGYDEGYRQGCKYREKKK